MNPPARLAHGGAQLNHAMAAPDARPHLPLSERLAALLVESPASEALTVNRLMERTEGRGLYLVMVLLCVPFVIPVSPPGLSTVLGSIVALLSLGLAVGARPRLPGFIGERPLPPGLRRKLLGGGVKFLRFIERWVRPRRTTWLAWRAARCANALLIAFMAFLLALPLPAPPFFFTNTLPGYAIILLAVSMMEEDGILIWCGYAAALVTTVFFGVITGAIWEILSQHSDTIRHWLGLR